VRTLCGDLCSESIQRIRWDVYLVATFQHELYTIRRKHLFTTWVHIVLPSPPKFSPFPVRPFCHSYLNLSLISGLPGTPITPCPYGVPNGDGRGGSVWVVGDCGLWGAGGRVQSIATSLFNSNSILYS
jgi:hypothetical protein